MYIAIKIRFQKKLLNLLEFTVYSEAYASGAEMPLSVSVEKKTIDCHWYHLTVVKQIYSK
jgi:hypothetical protein